MYGKGGSVSLYYVEEPVYLYYVEEPVYFRRLAYRRDLPLVPGALAGTVLLLVKNT